MMLRQNKEFPERLNVLLDSRGFAPKGEGRQVKLAKKYAISQAAVNKWFEGKAVPRRDKIIIARDFQCNNLWLEYGEGEMDVPMPISKKLQTIEDWEANEFLDLLDGLSREQKDAVKNMAKSYNGSS